MMASFGLVLLVLCACFNVRTSTVLAQQSKYSEKLNPENDSQRFRTKIVQQVWEKANRMNMLPDKLAELTQMLQQHDIKMLQLKKHQQDGGDPDGETEALLRRRLSDIMQRFGMIPFEEGKSRKANIAKETRRRDTAGQDFIDHKLNKLWMKAQQSPTFNALELDQLKEELTHHQDKLEQFEQLSSQLYGERARDSNRVDIDKKPIDPAERSVLELDLKIQHRELNSDFQRLSNKMIPDEHKGDFVEPRVINLWREAKFANFTEEELESIKTELKHFEAKITKYENLQVQSLHAEKEYRISKKLGESVDSLKHRSLKEEAKDLGTSVHQFMNDMKGRIQRGRDRVDEL